MAEDRNSRRRRDDLAARIERIYMEHPEGWRSEAGRRRGPKGRGQRWFARRYGWSEKTVRAWISGLSGMSARAERALEAAEREAGIRR